MSIKKIIFLQPIFTHSLKVYKYAKRLDTTEWHLSENNAVYRKHNKYFIYDYWK